MVRYVGKEQKKARNSNKSSSEILNDPKIALFIQSEIAEQLSKEREIVRDVFSFSVKIIGFSITLFFAVFAIFGLTTWSEIVKRTEKFTKERIDLLIVKEGESANVREALNDYYNLSMVNAYIVKSLRAPEDASRPSNDLELSHSEWIRLSEWIKSERLSVQEFGDTLKVLSFQSDARKVVVSDTLVEMLALPRDSFNGSERVKVIFDNFEHRGLVPAAVNLISSNSFEENIRIHANKYVRNYEYEVDFHKLFREYKQMELGDLKKETLLTCYHLRPRSLVKELEPLMKLNTYEAVDSISSIIVNPKRSLSGFLRSEHSEMSVKLLYYLINNGASFEDDNYSVHLKFNKAEFTGINHYLSFGEFEDVRSYWHTLRDLANTNQIDLFRKILIKSDSDYLVKIYCENECKIDVDADEEMSLSLIKGDFAYLQSALSRDSVIIKWRDNEGSEHHGNLVGFLRGNFRVKLNIDQYKRKKSEMWHAR